VANNPSETLSPLFLQMIESIQHNSKTSGQSPSTDSVLSL